MPICSAVVARLIAPSPVDPIPVLVNIKPNFIARTLGRCPTAAAAGRRCDASAIGQRTDVAPGRLDAVEPIGGDRAQRVGDARDDAR